jgi:2-polyprenyl-3-methyl-5-hydroxy-6-metoxy-1,4-benzoquinol methylase
MIAIAGKQLPEVDFRVMDVRDLLVLPGKFDAVMCSFCLPFLSKADTKKLIVDCSEKLNRGGVIYISTMEGNESDAGFETTSFSAGSEIYFNYHSQEDLKQAFIASGFEISRLKLQEYLEPDGRVTIDMIFIEFKK